MKKLMKKIAILLCTILAINSVVAGSTIPAKAADGEANVTFSYHNNSLSYGEVQWKNGSEEWHTQSEDGTVSATHLRIKYSNAGQLEQHTALMLDGNNIISEKQSLLESEEGLVLEANQNYAFQNIEFISNNSGSGSGAGQPKGMLNFVCQDNKVTGGHIAYKFNGANEFSHVGENSEEKAYENLNLNGVEALNSFTIKFEPSQGYQLDTSRGVRLLVNGNERYSGTGDSIAGFLGDNGYTFNLNDILNSGETVGDSSFELEFGFESQNGGGGQHGPEPGMINLLCQDLEEAALVMYRFGTDETKTFIPVENNTIAIPTGESNVTIQFIMNDPEVYMLDTGRGVSLNVNGEEKYHLSGKDAEKVLVYTFNLAELAGDKAVAESSYELSYGFQYADPSMDTRPRNMLWVYSEEYGKAHHFVDPQGDVDCLVLNGDVDIIAIEYGGTTYSKAELLELGSKEEGQRGDVWYEVDPGKMGYAQIPSGATVTVKLLPDYGYQVLRAELNGSEIAPAEEQSVFTFTMPTNPLHLSAVFTSCEDEVVTSAEGIESGTIKLGANEMNAGSALLSVGATENGAVFDGTIQELTGYEISSCLDIGLQQVFYKGTKEDYWSNNKDTLASKATVSLSLSDEVGSDVKVLHEKHDGTVEILDATVENGVVTFETSSFSTYAIIKAETSTPEPETTTPSTTTPEKTTPSTTTPETSTTSQSYEESNVDNAPVSTSHAGGSGALETTMLIRDINATSAGNTLIIDRGYNRQFLSNAEMKALLKKGTVALRMQYRYNGVEYDITIHAGTAIDDNIPFYGPLYLASRFPATKAISKGNVGKVVGGKATKGVITGNYVINSGDSLYKIARKFGTSISDLQQKNPQIKNINLIHPGQTINI